MPRRRRRRRRPPSKCHPLTVEAVEKCSKHSFYLRALKITVIRNPFNCVLLLLCGHAVYHPAKAFALLCNQKKSQKNENLQQIKSGKKKKKKKKKKKILEKKKLGKKKKKKKKKK